MTKPRPEGRPPDAMRLPPCGKPRNPRHGGRPPRRRRGVDAGARRAGQGLQLRAVGAGHAGGGAWSAEARARLWLGALSDPAVPAALRPRGRRARASGGPRPGLSAGAGVLPGDSWAVTSVAFSGAKGAPFRGPMAHAPEPPRPAEAAYSPSLVAAVFSKFCVASCRASTARASPGLTVDEALVMPPAEHPLLLGQLEQVADLVLVGRQLQRLGGSGRAFGGGLCR